MGGFYEKKNTSSDPSYFIHARNDALKDVQIRVFTLPMQPFFTRVTACQEDLGIMPPGYNEVGDRVVPGQSPLFSVSECT